MDEKLKDMIETLIAVRCDLGISIAEVSRRSGVPKTSLSEYERFVRVPQTSSFLSWAESLNVGVKLVLVE